MHFLSHEEVLNILEDEVLGPVERNSVLVNYFEAKIENFIHNTFAFPDKEKKNMQKTLKMMVNEFKSNVAKCKDMVDGIAVIHMRFTRLVKGSILLLFNRGGLLVLEVSKTKVRASWQNMKRIDLQKLKNKKECDEFVEKKHAEMVGIDRKPIMQKGMAVSRSGKEMMTNVFDDSDYSESCRRCRVPIRSVRKNKCAGCLEARYCTRECQEADWDCHGHFCREIKDRREKEKLGLVKSLDGNNWVVEGHAGRCEYEKHCWSCFLEDEDYSLRSVKTLLCSGCRRARYCDKDCQTEDWDRHKKFCQAKINQRLLKEFRFLSTKIFV